MNKKYRCLGGYVFSKSDGDRHYITARRVAELYGVNPSECLLVDSHNSDRVQRGLTLDYLASLIDLWPDSSGRYKLPTNQENKS